MVVVSVFVMTHEVSTELCGVVLVTVHYTFDCYYFSCHCVSGVFYVMSQYAVSRSIGRTELELNSLSTTTRRGVSDLDGLYTTPPFDACSMRRSKHNINNITSCC